MRMHIFIAEHANRTGPTGAAMEKNCGTPFSRGACLKSESVGSFFQSTAYMSTDVCSNMAV